MASTWAAAKIQAVQSRRIVLRDVRRRAGERILLIRVDRPVGDVGSKGPVRRDWNLHAVHETTLPSVAEGPRAPKAFPDRREQFELPPLKVGCAQAERVPALCWPLLRCAVRPLSFRSLECQHVGVVRLLCVLAQREIIGLGPLSLYPTLPLSQHCLLACTTQWAAAPVTNTAITRCHTQRVTAALHS